MESFPMHEPFVITNYLSRFRYTWLATRLAFKLKLLLYGLFFGRFGVDWLRHLASSNSNERTVAKRPTV